MPISSRWRCRARWETASGSAPGMQPTLLDAIEILGAPVTLCHGPTRAAFEHAVHLDLIESDLPRTADASRDRPEQTVGQCLSLQRRQILALETRQQCAHPAGDVEPDASSRHDPARIGVESGYAADWEAIAPMRVRHRIGRVHDTRQAGHIA